MTKKKDQKNNKTPSSRYKVSLDTDQLRRILVDVPQTVPAENDKSVKITVAFANVRDF